MKNPTPRINPIAREVLDTFDGVYAQVKSFVNNLTSAINGLLVSGDAGTGKTYTVKKALADLGVISNVEYIKGGKITAASLYVKLYLNRAAHRVVVLDDVDIIHHSEKNKIIPMILGACELGHNREVSWETAKANALMEAVGAPMKFKFEGTVIWITNDTVDDISKACKQWKAALLSRFNVARCYFTDEQKYMYTMHLCENVGMLNGKCVDHKMLDGTPGYPEVAIDETLDYLENNYRNLVEITPRIALRICDTLHYEQDPIMRKKRSTTDVEVMSKDKKPDLYDVFNDDSLWGNQETDALTHDEIMDTEWYRRKTDTDKEWFRQSTLERNKDPVFMKRLREALSSPAKTQKNKEYMLSLWQDKQYAEQQSKAQLAYYKNNPDAIERSSDHFTKQWSNPENNMVKANSRPISTPHGLFSNVMPLTKVLHETDFGRKTIEGTDKKIRALLNSDKHTDWNWISREEYNAKA